MPNAEPQLEQACLPTPPTDSSDGQCVSWARGLRVALFVNSVEMGGVEEHVRQLGAGLRTAGAEVALICPESPDIDPMAIAVAQVGVDVHRITLSWRTGPSGCLARFSRLVRLLRARRFQILHIHLTGYNGGRWVVLAGRLAGVAALICTIQIAPERRERRAVRLERRLMNLFIDRFIAVSEITRGRLLAYLSQSATKTTVIPNAVELDRYQDVPRGTRQEIRGRFGIPAEAPVIGTAARLSAQKGHTYLIAAIPELLASVPNAHVLLVGDGPLRSELEDQARALDLDHRVHFAGYQREIPAYLSAMDVFVLPSLFEGLPLSVLEAMAAGVPVIATAVDGTPEAVQHGIAGWLIPPKDPRAIAQATIALLNAPETMVRMADAGRARAREFSTNVLLNRICGVYRFALAGSNDAD
jgi:glycosyltransferase involved in cell wall biosynthesis